MIAIDNTWRVAELAFLDWRRLSNAPLTGIAQIGGIYVGILLFTFALEFIQTY